jgi:hypothetical protein
MDPYYGCLYCDEWGVCMTDNNRFWIGLDDWIYWHFYYNYNQLWQLTINNCLRLTPFLTGLRVSSHPLRLTWFWFTKHLLLLLRLPWTMTVLWMTPWTLWWMQNDWPFLDWTNFQANQIQITTSKSSCSTLFCPLPWECVFCEPLASKGLPLWHH